MPAGALVDACTQVISLTKPIKREAGVVKSGYGGVIELTVDQMANPSAGIDHAAVLSAYGAWLAKSLAAFDRAIAMSRRTTPRRTTSHCRAGPGQ